VTKKHVELITALPNTLLKASDEHNCFINKEQHDYDMIMIMIIINRYACGNAD
jgi:hypothetical protein